nr:phosphate regulon transcriptional regulatory protein PhoB [Raoultella sp. NCTC 9187]
MARRILVVEDEAPIREMVCFVLEQNGFQPVEAEDFDSAVNQLNEPWPDLILLDWMLPGGSGLQFIKQLKREAMTRDIPVVMLTARGEEEDRVRGLETGADDYITKPFSPKELVARIKAVMRRISPMAVEEVIEMQGLSLDPSSHRVMTGENPLDMGPTEFKLLHFFMTHPERGIQPRAAAESRLGNQRVCRRPNGRRAYSPSCVKRWNTVAMTGWYKRFAARDIVSPPVSECRQECEPCWNGCHGKGLALELFYLVSRP